MAKPSNVGKEVFCKRNSTTGTIAAEDEATVTIAQSDGTSKTVTRGTFDRWYVFSDTQQAAPTGEEQAASSVENSGTDTSQQPTPPEKSKKPKETRPAGEPGIGAQLRDKFLQLVKELAQDQPLDISYDEKTRRDIIKMNNRNVFECTFAKKRFNVLAHPDSLTPDNVKRADKMFPKEWGWALRAKFVFTDMSQWPLMKTIIADGLYYRHKNEPVKEEAKNDT